MARDITGQRFARLLVLHEEARVTASGHRTRVCQVQCDCGSVFFAAKNNITGSKTKSCGCLQRGLTASRFRTHGECSGPHRSHRTPEYRTWRRIIESCEKESLPVYQRIGALGVRVSPQWRAEFSQFLADVGRKPTPWHALERIDESRNFEPGNCEWRPSNKTSARWHRFARQEQSVGSEL